MKCTECEKYSICKTPCEEVKKWINQDSRTIRHKKKTDRYGNMDEFIQEPCGVFVRAPQGENEYDD